MCLGNQKRETKLQVDKMLKFCYTFFEDVMKNSEIINQIIKKLEENHINLYHDVSKEEITNYVKSIKNKDELSAMQFDKEMLKLFALFKDAHTSYRIKWLPLNQKLTFIKDKFYILVDEKWEEIERIGDLSIKEFYSQIKSLINFETKAWLNYEIMLNIKNGYIYQMLGLFKDDKVIVHLKDKRDIEIKFDETRKLNRISPYSYKIINDNILFFKYQSCTEQPDFPFKDFLDDMAKEVKKKNIKKYILDVRGNTGGNSEILNPFQNFVKEKKLKGVMLIDNGVFSSGRIAVARFKKEFNLPLIGEPTGGAVKSYGFIENLQVEDKRFTVSKKFWNFSDIFGYEGSIIPDIYVPTKIEDLQNKYDRQLEMAICTLQKDAALTL